MHFKPLRWTQESTGADSQLEPLVAITGTAIFATSALGFIFQPRNEELSNHLAFLYPLTWKITSCLPHGHDEDGVGRAASCSASSDRSRALPFPGQLL